MTFRQTDLSVLAYANNFTLWHYKTTDSSITTEGYFNDAATIINENDLIIANIYTDVTPYTKFYTVMSVENGRVELSLFK